MEVEKLISEYDVPLEICYGLHVCKVRETEPEHAGDEWRFFLFLFGILRRCGKTIDNLRFELF
jgi:hypothetical protein